MPEDPSVQSSSGAIHWNTAKQHKKHGIKNYRDETSDAADTTFYVHTTFTPNGLEHNA